MKKIVLLIFCSILLFSCKKEDDDFSIVPPRDRVEQYTTDSGLIEEYLKNNYMVVDANMDVTVNKITDPATQVSIWDQTQYPLQSMTGVINDNRRS